MRVLGSNRRQHCYQRVASYVQG